MRRQSRSASECQGESPAVIGPNSSPTERDMATYAIFASCADPAAAKLERPGIVAVIAAGWTERTPIHCPAAQP